MKIGFTKSLWKNDVAEAVAIVVTSLIGPWWSFVVVVWIASYDRARKNQPAILPPALVAAGTWFVMAFTRDAMNGFRISRRIGGFFSLPHGSLLYLVVITITFLLAILSAASGAQLGRSHGAKAAR